MTVVQIALRTKTSKSQVYNGQLDGQSAKARHKNTQYSKPSHGLQTRRRGNDNESIQRHGKIILDLDNENSKFISQLVKLPNIKKFKIFSREINLIEKCELNIEKIVINQNFYEDKHDNVNYLLKIFKQLQKMSL